MLERSSKKNVVTERLIIVRTTLPELGGSEYYETIHGLTGGHVPNVDLRRERAIIRAVTKLVQNGEVEAVHDISRGGLAAGLSKMAIQGKNGFKAQLDPVPAKAAGVHQLLFSESKPRYILEAKPSNASRLIRRLRATKNMAARIGRVQGDNIEFTYKTRPKINIALKLVATPWSETMPRTMRAAT